MRTRGRQLTEHLLLDGPVKGIEREDSKLAVETVIAATSEKELGQLRNMLHQKWNFLIKLGHHQ